MSAALITAIAEGLFKRYQDRAKNKKLDKDLLPNSAADIAGALTSLMPGFINLQGATNATPALLNKVEKQIKSLQGFAGNLLKRADGLLDGVLGKKTMSWLAGIKRCKGELEHTPSTEKVKSPEGNNNRIVRYWHAKSALPQVDGGDPAVLLVKAFQAWMGVIKLSVLKATKKDGANVIVSTIDLGDGKGGTLADAHVGPPSGMVRHLRFDKAETWDANKFQATACHEIGHLLGLQHASGPGQLMSPLYQPGIIGPTDADVAAALSMNWKKFVPKPEIRRVVPNAGDPIINLADLT